jgi:hypothetical protein
MAVRTWEAVKIRFCEHAGSEVSLEAEKVYPIDILSDQPARLLAHRCSRGLECSQDNKAACVWAGTNPNYDPFEE